MVETEGNRPDADGTTSETAPEEITATDELIEVELLKNQDLIRRVRVAGRTSKADH